MQTRTAKRSGIAAVNYALNRIEAGTLDRDNLPNLINPKQVLETIQPTVDSKGFLSCYVRYSCKRRLSVRCSLPHPDAIIAANNAGKDAIYLAYNTCTDDLEMISRAVGVVKLTGGFTCHAAVICRAMG
ncbi:pyruvate,phosphate dikinase [Vibrio phage J14]|nr:pyruvate,phosphate dikinase [Vibrio phage J14]